MKSIHAKYLVLLLMMSFGSASLHALVDHESHGCEACILSASQKSQFSIDTSDDADADTELAIVPSNIRINLLAETQTSVFNYQDLQPHSSVSNYSIRAPPVTLS
jgi:hypothetical protein